MLNECTVVLLGICGPTNASIIQSIVPDITKKVHQLFVRGYKQPIDYTHTQNILS